MHEERKMTQVNKNKRQRAKDTAQRNTAQPSM